MKSKVTFASLGKLGQLGNQMWQIIATIAYALKHNKFVEFPEWEYFKYFDFPFPVNDSIVVDKVYNEPFFHYTEIPYFDGDVDLRGYFQSPKYHEDVDPTVLFELKSEWKKYVENLYAKINPKGLRTCSVHLRRKDYLLPEKLEYHGVLDLSYYNNAVSRLYGDEFDDVLYIVCSDDIAYCKEHIKFKNIYFSEGELDIIDLFLMAKCSDNIISNSSFSWWSAMLNRNKDKKVIAPKNWFNAAQCDTKDLIPENWIKI